jgi:hypothetical protein
MTADGKTESTYTYKRLADEDGHAVVELRTDFTSGQFAGTWSTSRYIPSRKFRFEDAAISFGKHCTGLFSLSDKMEKEQETPAETLSYIVDAAVDYAASVRFAGKETAEGRSCDRYTYHYLTKGPNETIFDGEVWLNGTVPFGLVREAATLKDGHGKVTSKYSMTLTATGTDQAVASGEAAAPPVAKSGVPGDGKLTFGQAFQKGLLECVVRVDPASKDGSRLFIVATNKGEAPLHLTLPAGAESLEVGTPIETLHLRARKAHTFVLGPGESTPEFTVAQEGDRRALEGKFTISVYEGTPLFSGSVTMGPVGR